jgi:hypothetical protein
MMLALPGANGPLTGRRAHPREPGGPRLARHLPRQRADRPDGTGAGQQAYPGVRGPCHGSRLDPAGTALITLAVLAVFYPLIEGRQLGWPTCSLACLGASVPLIAAFAALETRTGQPLIDFSLFRRRGPAIGLGIAVVFFGTTSFFFVLTLFLSSDWATRRCGPASPSSRSRSASSSDPAAPRRSARSTAGTRSRPAPC